jgi:hypothetical protein
MVQGQKHHFLYKTTCKVTGRYYVGVHSTQNLEDSYLGSGKFLGNSIAKYGKENHEREILQFFDTREDLMKREKDYVNKEMLKDKLCMNLKQGGEGGINLKDKETHKRIIEASRESFRKNCKAGKHKEMFAKHNREMHAAGKIKPPDWTGKKHSEETKQKIGEAQKKLRREDNSQFGKKWMFHPIRKESRTFKQNEIELLIKEGWILGRKLNWSREPPDGWIPAVYREK